MAMIVLASAAGSPGATTSALGLALTWPRPVLLIEADPTHHHELTQPEQHSQTKNASARSLVQDSGAPAWLRAAARSRRSQLILNSLLAVIHRLLNFDPLGSIVDS
jgi:sugar diacid utilization regulator